MIPAVVLASVMGLHFGGDAQACLGRGALGTAVSVQWHEVVQLEEELVTTFGVAPEQALTIFTNVSVGVLSHGVRPYVVVGAGRMMLFSAVSKETGFAWNMGGGVALFHGNVGVRLDVRYVQGPFTFARVSTGFVVKTH